MFSSVLGIMMTCSKSSDDAKVIGLFFNLRYEQLVPLTLSEVESIEPNLDSFLMFQAIAASILSECLSNAEFI